jgi:solute carrier family 8 (sodium/calcium exchanger)
MLRVVSHVLAVVYGFALAWCFFGIAIISDTIMEVFEGITSVKRSVTRPARDGRMLKVSALVWDPTVANFTLTALGTSAPEIMLAVIEALLTLGRPQRQLGSSTILGMVHKLKACPNSTPQHACALFC